MVDIQCVLFNSRNNLLGYLTKSKLVLDLTIDSLEPIDGVLHIHLVCVIILEHMMRKIIRQLQAQHVILKWNQVHIDLRYLFLLKKFVFIKQLVTFDSSSRHEQNVDLLVIRLFPGVSLVNNLFNDIDVWSYRKDDRLILWLDDILVRQNHLLLDF